MVKNYHNSPIKMCETCHYRKGRGFGARCQLGGYYCSIERQFANMPGARCNEEFSGWRQRPPRRSVRRWLYDLFWRI